MNVIPKDCSSLCVCVILKFNNGLGRERRQSSILHFRLNAHISNSVLCLLLKKIEGDTNTVFTTGNPIWFIGKRMEMQEEAFPKRVNSKDCDYSKDCETPIFIHSYFVKTDLNFYRVNCHAILFVTWLSIQICDISSSQPLNINFT